MHSSCVLVLEDASPHVRMVQGPQQDDSDGHPDFCIGCLQSGTLISAPTNAAVIKVSMKMMHFFDVSKNDKMFSGFCLRIQARLNRCCRRWCCSNCQKQKIAALGVLKFLKGS